MSCRKEKSYSESILATGEVVFSEEYDKERILFDGEHGIAMDSVRIMNTWETGGEVDGEEDDSLWVFCGLSVSGDYYLLHQSFELLFLTESIALFLWENPDKRSKGHKLTDSFLVVSGSYKSRENHK